MWLRFQRRPWDLLAVVSYTTVGTIAILSSGGGALWWIFLVLFVPGYVVVAALFPGEGLTARLREAADRGERLLQAARSFDIDVKPYRKDLTFARDAATTGLLSEAVGVLQKANERLQAQLEDRAKGRQGEWEELLRQRHGTTRNSIDWTERIVLSFGLSIAIVSLASLLLNATPFGIGLDSIVLVLLLFTVLVGLVAFARRIRLPVEDRLSATIEATWPAWRHSSNPDRLLGIVLAATIVFAGAVVVSVALTPRPIERFTQFFLLDSNGTVDPTLYPTRLNVSEPGTVIIGLVNNESVRVDYEVRIDLVGVEFVYNPTTGLNETIERNRTPKANFSKTLESREVWRQPYTFMIDAPGDWIVEFRLLRGGNFTGQYLQLRVQVLPRP